MQNEKDIKPPYQTELDSVEKEKETVKREGWDSEEISDQASQQDEDEVRRRFIRGDETKGEPDERDAAGSVNSDITPQGREEAKNDQRGAANKNG